MMDTRRLYSDQTTIKVGDTIVDENGCQGTVFLYKGKFRVAEKEEDLKYNMSMSLGLFIIGGIYKVENGAKIISD